jgi:predicted phage terminase large subunit-like protein
VREVRKVLDLARTGASAKERRANPFASQCEQGLVKLVEEQWKRVFNDELCAFPYGAHDGQVDASAVARMEIVTSN